MAGGIEKLTVSEEGRSVMGALVRAPRPQPVSAAAKLTQARAWKLVVPRAAEELAGLVAVVEDVRQDELAIRDVFDGWSETTLAISLSGPEGAAGIALLDATLVAGLIEAQTIGRVIAAPPADRAPTDVDATLCAHLLDRWMQDQATAMEAAGDSVPHWRCGERFADARAAGLVLEDGMYDRCSVGFDLGSGAKRGGLQIVTPHLGGGPIAEGPQANGVDPRLAARVQLRAVLHRPTISLDRLRKLAPGDTIVLPKAAVGRVAVEGADGRRVVKARLGRLGGFRALRIGEATDDTIASESGSSTFAQKAMPEPPGEGLLSLPDAASAPGLHNPDGPAELPDLPDIPPSPDVSGGADSPLESLPPLDGLPPLGDLPPLETPSD